MAAQATTPNVLRTYGSATAEQLAEGLGWYRNAHRAAASLDPRVPAPGGRGVVPARAGEASATRMDKHRAILAEAHPPGNWPVVWPDLALLSSWSAAWSAGSMDRYIRDKNIAEANSAAAEAWPSRLQARCRRRNPWPDRPTCIADR